MTEDHIPNLPILELPVGGTLVIDVYSDLHVGSALADLDLLKAHLKATALNPSRYLVLNGDLVDAAQKSAKHGAVYEASMNLDDSLDWLEAALAPVADKIVAITSGNHDGWAFAHVGLDPTKQLAARLKKADRYMRDGGYLVTRHGVASNSHKRYGGPRPIEYEGFINHGTGTSATIHNLREKAYVFAADYHAFGHTHQTSSFPVDRIERYAQTNTIRRRTSAVGVAGSYLRYGGYALEKTLRPARLGHISYHLQDGEKRVDITWS